MVQLKSLGPLQLTWRVMHSEKMWCGEFGCSTWTRRWWCEAWTKKRLEMQLVETSLWWSNLCWITSGLWKYSTGIDREENKRVDILANMRCSSSTTTIYNHPPQEVILVNDYMSVLFPNYHLCNLFIFLDLDLVIYQQIIFIWMSFSLFWRRVNFYLFVPSIYY